MKSLLAAILNSKTTRRLAILVAVFCALAATPLLSGAQTQASVTIVNDSSWEIRHIYLSPVNSDNWGPDQLNELVINPGDSFTVNFSCDQSQIKVITEDKDGCFLSNTVACSSNAVWTITNAATPNCGG